MLKKVAPSTASGWHRDHAVIIGAGLGGLAAAMRLGARGYRVTVLDRLDGPGGRASAVQKGGHRFDLVPATITLPQVFRDLWSACGRDFDQDVALRPLDPLYEIRWPDGSTFSARRSPEAMRAEVLRLAPADLAGYDRYLKDAAQYYGEVFEPFGRRPMHDIRELARRLPALARLRAGRSAYFHVARRIRDDRLRMALSLHPLFTGGDPFRAAPASAQSSHAETAFGSYHVAGGIQGLSEIMGQIIRDQGGLLRFGVEADQIVVSDGRASGVRLATGEEIAADIVVSNADPGHTYERLLRKHDRRRWTDRRLRAASWSMGVFAWHFGTRDTRSHWSDVAHHTILPGPRFRDLMEDVFRKGRLSDDMLLFVHRPGTVDRSVAPPSDDTFCVLSPVPHLGHDNPVDWEVEAERYRQRIEKVLEDRLLPGLGERIGESFVRTPLDLRDRYLSPLGCGYSLDHRPLQSGWFRPHHKSEDLPGLFLTGAGTHPGAGVSAVICSAEAMSKVVPEPRQSPRSPSRASG